MRALILGLLLLSLAWGQGKVKEVTFYSDPPDAQVLIAVSGTRPFVLGRCGEPINLDLQLFAGRKRVALTFRREGWLDEERVLQNEGQESHYFSNRDRFPDAEKGPVQLAPRTDAASRAIQARFFVRQHAAGLVGLAVAGLTLAGLAVFFVRRSRAHSRRLQQLEGQKASLDHTDKVVFTEVDGYRLLEQLGEGGMGAVYRAVPKDTMDVREAVAIKILDRKMGRDEESRKRFEREVLISKKLVHPNIVRLIDWGEQDGLLYMVMEYLEGHSLYAVIPPEGMSLSDAVAVFQPLAKGLAEAHRHGVVHRDLKPGNIFLTKKGGLKILDFGIARGHNFTVATATGQAMGTPAYMAPEQLMGEIDPRSDQYALGVVMFELLTGSPPFRDADPFALAMQHVNKAPPRLCSLRPELPAAVEEVVMRMLAKSPEQRYRNVEEAAAAMLSAAGCR